MKKSVSILVLTLVLVMTMTALTACGGEKSNTSAPNDSSAELSGETVKVGVVVPLTGAQAIFGEDLRHGMELAVEKINAEGGVLNGELELVIEDDATQAAQSATAATKLISMAIIGGIASLEGGTLGAIILTVLPEMLRGFDAQMRMITYGILVILVLIFLPDGLISLLGKKPSEIRAMFKDRVATIFKDERASRGKKLKHAQKEQGSEASSCINL